MHWIGGWFRRGGQQKKKILSVPGIEPQSFSPQTSHYTDRDIPALGRGHERGHLHDDTRSLDLAIE